MERERGVNVFCRKCILLPIKPCMHFFCQPVQHLATLGALEAQFVPLLSLGQHLLCHVHCLATLWALGPSSPPGHPEEESEQYQ